MILPWPQRIECREVSVSHSAGDSGPSHAGNIDANVILPNLCDNGAAHAVLHYAEYTNQAIEEPYRTRSKEPVIVEIVSPLEDDMVPTSDNNKDSQDDVQDQEELVRQPSEVEMT